MSGRVTLSKLLSLVLRHEPGRAGVTLDNAGWVDVEVLLAGLTAHGQPMTRAVLEEIVATSDKKRFAVSADGLRIRASQGHSVEVELGYEPRLPPEILLRVRAGSMATDGHLFFLSTSGVWLTHHVPAAYLVFPDEG